MEGAGTLCTVYAYAKSLWSPAPSKGEYRPRRTLVQAAGMMWWREFCIPLAVQSGKGLPPLVVLQCAGVCATLPVLETFLCKPAGNQAQPAQASTSTTYRSNPAHANHKQGTPRDREDLKPNTTGQDRRNRPQGRGRKKSQTRTGGEGGKGH